MSGKPNLIFAGTVRQYRAWAPNPVELPVDATHVSVWELGERVATLSEKTAFRKGYVWEGGAWVATESHYVAARMLRQ